MRRLCADWKTRRPKWWAANVSNPTISACLSVAAASQECLMDWFLGVDPSVVSGFFMTGLDCVKSALLDD